MLLDRVPAELKEKNTPGAVIAIVSGDQVVYQKAGKIEFLFTELYAAKKTKPAKRAAA